MLLPGVYVWVSTVAQPAFARGTHPSGRVTAVLAALALVGGVVASRRGSHAGRLLGSVGFVALALVTWLLVAPALSPARLEPVRAALGSVGWALFALGWGVVRDSEHVPEDDPRSVVGAPLPARGALPVASAWVLGAAILLGALPALLAWQVARPSAALLAHAGALLACMALITSGARIAVERGRRAELPPPGIRLARGAASLGVLALVLALATVWMILR